jgi:CARDB
LEFFDSDPAVATSEERARERRGRPRRPPRQQIMARRGIALGAALLILILLVLGVRGCLNARKERALKDYAGDVTQIVDETERTSGAFFDRLRDPGALSVTEFEAEVNADRSAMDQYLSRVEGLDVPGDMSRAQNGLELVYQLRAGAMAEIAQRLSFALGDAGREAAIEDIAQQMRTLLASDVLYAGVVRPEINGVLADEGIEGSDVPESQFLPDGIEWLDESAVDSALSGVTGAGTAAGTCPCGTGLVAATLDDTTLQEGVPVTVSSDAPELDVQVQNQGASDLSGVTVAVTVDGGDMLTADISSIAPGETQTVTIPLTPVPQGEVTLDVVAQPVPGEEVTDNNQASYTVTFQ